VTNAGSNGKFLGVLDLDVQRRQGRGLSLQAAAGVRQPAAADRDMEALIERCARPTEAKLGEKLAVTEGCSTAAATSTAPSIS
jgi:sulfur-oxidizing protein SoxB